MNNIKTNARPANQEFDLPGIHHVSPMDAYNALKMFEATLLDVREDHECAIEWINYDATVFQPMSTILEHVQDISKFKPLIVVSKNGVRSVKIANLLKRQGFENVMNLDGGISAWKSRNFPTESIFDGEHCHDCDGHCNTCN